MYEPDPSGIPLIPPKTIAPDQNTESKIEVASSDESGVKTGLIFSALVGLLLFLSMVGLTSA